MSLAEIGRIVALILCIIKECIKIRQESEARVDGAVQAPTSITTDDKTAGPHVIAPMILNAMSSSVLVIGEDWRVTFANPAAEQLVGFSRTVLYGTPLAEIMPEDSPLLDRIRRAQAEGSGVSDYSVELPFVRDVSHLMDLHISLLGDADDSIMVLLHPCSLAQRLNHHHNHRGRARSIAGLGATLAHEVKNPLSGIRGAAQLLETGVDDEERPLIRLICDETDRICALVDQMEQFADLKPLKREAVNIYEVLERVRRLAENGFGAKVKFTEHYDPSLPEVDGDRDQLVQVFLNLIKNAAEAVPMEEGEIVITTQFHHGFAIRVPNSSGRIQLPITVHIQDNGPGISPDVAAHVFEPFVSSKPSGSGLGLPLVAKIISDHGGVVEFENLNKGTVFHIHLPAYRAQTGKRKRD